MSEGKNMCGIYRIVRIDTGHEYIGHSHDMHRRWIGHRHLLNAGRHHSLKMQRAWTKHGEAKFAFEVIELCARADLVEREQYHLDDRKPWFNTAKAAGSRAGVPQSDAAKEKIRLALKGRVKTEETRRKLSAALAGRKLSPEHCLKIREVKSNPSPETRERLSRASRGRKVSAETRAKMSAAHKGRTFSPEHRAKITAAQIGRKFSDEHRAKLSAAHIGQSRQHSEETKQKMREAANRRFAEKRAAK